MQLPNFHSRGEKCEHKIISGEEILEIVMGKLFSQGWRNLRLWKLWKSSLLAPGTLLFQQALRDVIDLFLNGEIPADE